MAQWERFLAILEQEIRKESIPAWGVCRLTELSVSLPCRAARLLPQTGSVIPLALPYYTGEAVRTNLARYAWCDDYHQVAGEMLDRILEPLRQAFPQAVLLGFTDSSPIPEVEAAVRAGLGFRGKNGQLIVPGIGSRVFVCELVTDLLLPPYEGPPRGDCGQCRRCLEACPTGALSEKAFDKARCRSQITQKKGTLTGWEERQIREGGLAWGCDVCTAVCPWNRDESITPISGLRKNIEPWLTREKLERLLPEKSYGWRGSRVLERNLELLEKDGLEQERRDSSDALPEQASGLGSRENR